MAKETKPTPVTTRTPTKQMRLRALIAALVTVGLLSSAVVVRLGWLQLAQSDEWLKRAVSQQLSDTVVTARRGTIYDNNMEPLAESAEVWKIIMSPKDLAAVKWQKLEGADTSATLTDEQALEKVILDLRENGVGRNKEGKDARGGAVVVQMCKTGEILAMASYPTYNLATFNQDYTTLNADEMRPLFNRALAAFPPGSVYKMVTAIAAVDMGGFDPGYIIEDKGLYTFYESFQPKCHIWSLANPRTHGKINLMEAIAYSCNYYFYEVGRLTYDTYKKATGENPFDVVAKALGLGEPTGIELPEDTGARANAEEKNKQYAGEDAGWFGADVLQAVIGQSLNKFTPLQLACYTSALANKGTRYEATLLSRVVSWDYQDLIEEHTPTVASTLEISEKALAALDQGMRMTGSIGTAEQYLKDYPIAIACKTGTPQRSETYASGKHYLNAMMIAYLPADDPEIAIGITVEYGGYGARTGDLVVDIANAYFAMKDGTLEVDPYVDPRTVAQEDAAASDTAAQTAPDAANDAQTDTTAAEPQQATALAGVIEEENNDALLAQ